MAVSNYAPGQELSSIDFQSMIGGPLSAIVDTQAVLSTLKPLSLHQTQKMKQQVKLHREHRYMSTLNTPKW